MTDAQNQSIRRSKRITWLGIIPCAVIAIIAFYIANLIDTLVLPEETHPMWTMKALWVSIGIVMVAASILIFWFKSRLVSVLCAFVISSYVMSLIMNAPTLTNTLKPLVGTLVICMILSLIGAIGAFQYHGKLVRFSDGVTPP